MKKVAVVLSGCGVFDGSEIHEATSTLIALSMRGIAYQCFAPNIPQHQVINHLTGEEMNESRNVLVESARIARGDIKDLGDFSAEEYDAVIFPGGFGVAKNLCNLAFDGAACEVNEEIRKVIVDEKYKLVTSPCYMLDATIAEVFQGALNVVDEVIQLWNEQK